MRSDSCCGMMYLSSPERRVWSKSSQFGHEQDHAAGQHLSFPSKYLMFS